MKKKRRNYNCQVCGRETCHADGYCSKHYDQIKQYGYPLEDSPRRDTDPNNIEIEGELAEIELYGLLFETLDDKILIDAEDVDKIKDYAWKKSRGCIVGNNKILLPNLLLDTTEKVEYINGDFLDNRKENLRICNMTEQNRNRNIGSKLGKFISLNDCGNYKVMIYTKNKEQIYLGTFKNLEEAIKIRNNFLRENDSLCYQLQE